MGADHAAGDRVERQVAAKAQRVEIPREREAALRPRGVAYRERRSGPAEMQFGDGVIELRRLVKPPGCLRELAGLLRVNSTVIKLPPFRPGAVTQRPCRC